MSHEPIEQELRRVLAPEFADGGACAWDLYRYAADEATPAQAAEFEIHLATCAECREDLDAFRAESASEVEGAAMVTPLGVQRTPARPWVAGGLAAAAVLLVGLFLGVPAVLEGIEGTPHLRPKGPVGIDVRPSVGVRPKGPSRLQVAVQRGDQRFVAADEQRFETGDVLGFFYTAAAETWPVILFCDGAGRIEQVFPSGAAVPVPAGIEQPLPVSAVVEDGRICEWIVGFFSAHRPSLVALQSALRDALHGHGPDCTLPPIELEDVSVDIRLLHGRGDTR